MRLLKTLTVLSLLATAPCAVLAQDASGFDTGMIPSPRILKPAGEVKAAVVLVSDAPGWGAKEDGVAARMTGEGALVIGIDLPSYLADLAKDDGDCVYMVSDIEALSQQIQRSLDNSDYDLPIVAGVGAGGALALAIAAQTPPATIGHTLAADPDAGIALMRELCTPADKRTVGNRMEYGLTDGPLPDPVTVLLGAAAPADGRTHVDALKAKHDDIDVQDSDGDIWQDFSDTLSDLVANSGGDDNPLGLPLTVLDTKPTRDTMAIVLSGDGGWRDIDKEVGDVLQQQGMPVVGLDSLRYFWAEREPQEVANDVSRIIGLYAKRWNVKRVLLIGYSFGADVLPRTYNLLPAADRARVSQISLLAVSHQVDYKISVLGWLGAAAADGHGDPADDLKTINPALVQCVYGTDEEDDVCPTLKDTGIEVIPIEGGHHFDEDYPALVERILDGYDRRLGKPAP
ncbi:type IV secretory pathway VirJ component [Rhizobium sp. PP-F2F-G48]|uniref:virulence factor family protein n=1 Tax=Rhizobium sp. PP-F2F-G48 TaxID=2135651 RepID=UPI0010431FBC|nr:AcvB/VirJ family lysyl-phosphatidylglycerol hydrolase [Rhizobium sp. PP-F2F-G48]TCM55133.1 type IV secretory pathway VirJ component [Rhizobium sp. PP-F2F-G48]